MTSRAASLPSLQTGRVSLPPPPATNPPLAASDYGTLVKDYCVTCHNERVATGGLGLDQLSIEHVGEHPETWEKVVAKLRAGQMPPAGMPRPDRPALDAFVAYLETELDRAARAIPSWQGCSPPPQSTWYANAIRDLLAIEIDGDALLPIDETQHGFDNIGTALSVTSGLLERYLSAARRDQRARSRRA